MKVYVFGNPDTGMDSLAVHVAGNLEGFDFVFVSPNADLPFAGQGHVVLMDVVEGLDRVILMTEKDLDKIVSPRSLTVHDYDLGFQLKYLTKLGQLGQFSLIALPQSGNIDTGLVQKLLTKIVQSKIEK